MNYTQAQIDRANAVSLEDFLHTQGETLIKSGREYRWKEHDSLTVRGNKWFRHSQSKGGYPIDFVMEFYGKSFPEAVQLLTGESGEGQTEATTAPPAEFHLPLHNRTVDRAIQYLCESRGLNKALVEAFLLSGDIYEDAKRHNVVFVGRDRSGTPRYAHVRGTADPFRQDIAGSDKSYPFRYEGNGNQLFVFEAPIDLLSFICLYPQDWQTRNYLALGGVSGKALDRFLSERKDTRKVFLCLDSDTAGSEACTRLAQSIPGEIAVIRLVPARKDWNDVLRQQGDIPSRKFIAETITLRELPTAQPVPMLRMADVELTSVDWLWFPYIPFGKLTIIQGNPGEGKTYFAMRLAAACTNRKPLPGMETLEPFNIIYMLKITSDGRKLGLDQRIINPNLPDDPCSKVNRCVDNIFRIWQEGQADKLTQLVFCDLSTPKASPAKAKGKTLDSPELRALETQLSKDGMEPDAPFSVYDDIRGKLVTMGIPREQIAFIHEANTEVRKKELFSKVRSGQVRVLMGSTFKMGAGMNVQDRLIALHDLDCPWRPGDLEQRSGRIIRQGNRNKEVHIYRYVTEGTFDAYLWQTIENKQRFISQIMTSKSPVRSCEDIDETALSYAEIKALCAGDERIKEKMDLDVDVARLKLMRSNHQSQQYRLEDNLLRKFPEQIDAAKNMIAGLETDIQTLAAHPHPEDGFAGMEVKGDNLTDKDNAGAALLETCKEVKDLEPVPVGSYRGFQMALTLENFGRDYILTLKGQMSYRVELGRDARGNLVRIDNALNAMPERVTSQKAYLDNLYAQVKEAKAALGKPFPQEEELRVKSARLAELNAELNIDDKTPMERLAGDSDAVAKSTRPSILQKLRAPLPEQSSPKPKHKEMEVQL